MPLAGELQKGWATIRISLSNHLAYKLNFLLLVLGPIWVFFFIRYNLWSAIYSLEGIKTLQGYDFPRMLAYQVWVMIVVFLGVAYNSMNLAEDIRLGRISAYLIYPFGFWQYHFCGFLAFQLIQLGVSTVTLVGVLLSGWVQLPGPAALLNGVLFSLCVGLFWFQVSFVIGIIAFWLEETWVLRVMMMTVSQFLSGAVIPLEIFPAWLVENLYYLPFPYLIFVPVKIFMGEYQGSLIQAYAAILGWTLVAWAGGWALWRRGLRSYTAAGM